MLDFASLVSLSIAHLYGYIYGLLPEEQSNEVGIIADHCWVSWCEISDGPKQMAHQNE